MKKQIDFDKLKQLIYDNIDIIFAALEIETSYFNGNYYSTCPIHNGSDNPKAFSFNKKYHTWKCWTHECHNEHRKDIFGLIQAVLSKQFGSERSFSETLEWVYRILNIDKKQLKIQKGIVAHNDFSFFIDNFNKDHEIIEFSNPPKLDTKIPSQYFMNRGFSDDILIEFGVGDCYSDKVMKNRAIIPVHNQIGDKVIGILGRAVYENIEPKFLPNSGFKKGSVLYNHHRAKTFIEETNTIILVEGQGDVWRLWECGILNCVGIFGKDITPFQLELLDSMGVINIVVLLDHDQPGRESKIKMQRNLGNIYNLYFPKLSTNKDIGRMKDDQINKTLSKYERYVCRL